MLLIVVIPLAGGVKSRYRVIKYKGEQCSTNSFAPGFGYVTITGELLVLLSSIFLLDSFDPASLFDLLGFSHVSTLSKPVFAGSDQAETG